MQCLFLKKIMKKDSWDTLESELVCCTECPRLVAWREQVSREKRRSYLEEDYWGKPVLGFGDRNARILVIGLAPGAHGSNRTGRMFTGDASGDFLFPALYKAGFSTKPASISSGDDLKLKEIFISAVCRCVPPKNKPSREEQINCRRYLQTELALLNNVEGIVALGSIAFYNAFEIIKELFSIQPSQRPKFAHGKLFKWEASPIWLLSSYHPSRQNTQTGRLTINMFSEIWSYANKLLRK
jgi:uracil-DNA glycosylase